MKKIFIIVLIIAMLAAAGGFFYYQYHYTPEQSMGVTDINTFTNFRDGEHIPLDTSKQRILLIGDSMAYSLMFRAKNYCDYNGHELFVVTYVAATSQTYAQSDTLEYYVNQFKPTYIIFVIGANEMFTLDGHQRGKYFDRIIPQTHGIKTVWVGPPNWREDTGINDAMMEKFGPKQFFLSKNLRFTRVEGDVAHPDRKSSTMWMDSISSWIMRDSYFPIRLNRPETSNPVHVDFVRLVVKVPRRHNADSTQAGDTPVSGEEDVPVSGEKDVPVSSEKDVPASSEGGAILTPDDTI
ncbi:MAG: hypothetical protein J5595_01400 [Bacteroidales bacterium]|nr:hypothetical protein [Bacteroidales bacterium]